MGWLNSDGTGKSLLPWDGSTYPYIDLNGPASNQDYNNDFKSNNSQNLVISADDSPGTAAVTTNGVAVDYTMNFRIYLAWKWTQTVQGMANTPVYYYLGYINWQVKFHATAVNNSTPPIKNIDPLHGATADAAWTRSNAPPPALDYREDWAGSTSWQ